MVFIKYSQVFFGSPLESSAHHEPARTTGFTGFAQITDPPNEIYDINESHKARTSKLVRDPFMEFFSLALGLLCLLGGIFGGQSVQLIFGESYSVRGAMSTDKFLMFFLTLGIGLVLYQLVIVRIDGLLQLVRKKKLYFTQIGMLITLFFVVLTGYVYVIL